MPMKTPVATALDEHALDLCRAVQRAAHDGNAYAVVLLPRVRQIAREARTVKEAMGVIQSMTVDAYSRAAQDKIALLYDRAALRHEDLVVSGQPS